VFPEEEDVKQIFFDDNVHHRDPRNNPRLTAANRVD
ncbi:hypothetical protein AK812_SmicGene785, partial [Symbiodinium microadriaticum]